MIAVLVTLTVPLVSVVLVPAVPASAGPTATITNFGVGFVNPGSIVTGSDGNVWFTSGLHQNDRATLGIVRMTPSGQATNFPVGSPSTGAFALTNGPDGNIWFTSTGTKVGRITTAGVVTLFDVPVTGAAGITTGVDGNLWFTASQKVGRMTTTGVVTTFDDPSLQNGGSIVSGPDDRLWYTKPGSNVIGAISPGGIMATFSDPGINNPAAITVGSDQNLWFTNNAGPNRVGKVTTSGTFTMYPTPPGVGGPILSVPDGSLWFQGGRITTGGTFTALPNVTGAGLVNGPDGKIWSTEYSSDSIWRLDLDGSVLSIIRDIDQPTGITTGPDGNLWFTNSSNASIGRITPTGVRSTFTGTGVYGPNTITAGPDGNLWFTNLNNSTIGRISTSGVVSNFPLPAGTHVLGGITGGPDGNVWFADQNAVGSITPAGVVTIYAAPELTGTGDITTGSDGNLWVTTQYNHPVARVTTAGVFTFFGSGAADSIVAGPDNNLWIGRGNAIASVTTGGVITEFADPDIRGTRDMTFGADGNLWFLTNGPGSGSVQGVVGRMTTSGKVAVFSGTPQQIDEPRGITRGPDDHIWFTNFGTSSISMLSDVAAGAPDAPSAPQATGGDAQATVTWLAPGDGDSPITGYTVTASPGGQTCHWTSGPLSCVVTGLTNGTSYTFTVTASNAIGTSPTSNPSNAVTPVTFPEAPTNATAIGDDSQATVSWSAPASDGGSPIFSYKVTASPGGQTCQWFSGPLSCTVTGLTNGTSYTFTVTARNTPGIGPPSAPSNAVTPQPAAATRYVPLSPHRVLDSRDGTGGYNSPWPGGQSRDISVTGGSTTVPVSATSVVLNVTGVNVSAPTHLTVWPAGQSMPIASNLNLPAGQIRPNLVVVDVGANGKVSIFNNAGTVDVLADVVGYFGPDPTGGLYTPLTPHRVLDSRDGTGGVNTPWQPGQTNNVTVTGGSTTVPAGATAVVLNVTVTGASAGSHLTVWPAAEGMPVASNLNFSSGQTVANLVMVKVGAGGQLSIFNNAGTVNVIADVVGYYSPAGATFTGITPTRVLDSRDGTGGFNSPWPAGSRDVTAAGGATGVPANATAVVVNITGVGPTSATHLTAWPAGQVQPDASTLNLPAHDIRPNLAVVKVGASGRASIFNNAGSVDVLADVVGYFT